MHSIVSNKWAKFGAKICRHFRDITIFGLVHFILLYTIGPDRTHSATCGLGKETKKRKKKRQWQTGYLPRPPTSPYRSQSLHAGWPPVCSSIFQVLLKSVQWFCRCGWSKIALPHYFGHWLIQQLVLPYKQQLVLPYKPWFHDDSMFTMRRIALVSQAVKLNVIFVTIKRCLTFLLWCVLNLWRYG